MKQLFCISIMMVFLFASCGDSDSSVNVEPEVPERSIELSVYYEPQNAPSAKVPDYKARVFVYYDVYLDEHFTFEQGKITKRNGDIVIYPEDTIEIDADGHITIAPKYENKQVLLIIESKHYSGKLMSMSYHTFKLKYKSTFVFTRSLANLDYEITK